MARSFSFLLVTLFLTQIFGANVLFLSGVASPSHHIFNRALAVGLAKTHNVTFLSADLGKVSIPRLHYIHLEKVYEALYEGDDKLNLMEMTDPNPLKTFDGFKDYNVMSCEGNLASKGLETILNYPDDFKFDVVLHDFTCGSCLLPLIHKFNYPPLVAVTAFNIPPYSIFTIGGQKYPAIIPHYLNNYSVHMTFKQRAYNLYVYVLDLLWVANYIDLHDKFG